MTTNLELCGLALSRLGQGAITDLAGTDDVSITCNLHYQQAIDWTLREREWKIAVKRVAQSTPTGTPAYGWSSYYNVETDHLRTLDVRTTSLKDYDENATRWTQEGGAVLCDIDDGIKVKYLYRVTVTDIPSHIIDVISLNLASRICVPITNSKKLKEDLLVEYKEELKNAAALDGMQGKNRVIRSSRLTKVRMSGTPLAGQYV
jgi:hypothetical protein